MEGEGRGGKEGRGGEGRRGEERGGEGRRGEERGGGRGGEGRGGEERKGGRGGRHMIGQCVLLTIFYQEIKCADYSLHRVLLPKWVCLMHEKDAVQPSEANHTHTHTPTLRAGQQWHHSHLNSLTRSANSSAHVSGSSSSSVSSL